MSIQSFRDELELLLNKHNIENGSETPDFILADYLVECLMALNATIHKRASWYSRIDIPGQGSVPYDTYRSLD